MNNDETAVQMRILAEKGQSVPFMKRHLETCMQFKYLKTAGLLSRPSTSLNIISPWVFHGWTSSCGMMNQSDATVDYIMNIGHSDLYFTVKSVCLISWRLFDAWTSSKTFLDVNFLFVKRFSIFCIFDNGFKQLCAQIFMQGRSSKYIANSKGERLSPCLTLFSHVKYPDEIPFIVKRDFISLHIFVIKDFPLYSMF